MRVYCTLIITDTDHPHVCPDEDEENEIRIEVSDGVAISGSRTALSRWANELQMGLMSCE